MSTKFKLPTETVILPSKGVLYPEDSPLSKGEIEMKYMTAKEEDILTNTNYIAQGIVIDKLLESLIVTEGVNFEDILIGDKNAIMIAARILSYGAEYKITYSGKEHIIDLSKIDEKPIDLEVLKGSNNKFDFTLPKSGLKVTFKLLTHADEKSIEKDQEGAKKIDKDSRSEITTRMRHIITSVDGSDNAGEINDFVSNYLLATDARALRDRVTEIQPDVDLVFYPNGAKEGGVDLPIGVNFFWPEL